MRASAVADSRPLKRCPAIPHPVLPMMTRRDTLRILAFAAAVPHAYLRAETAAWKSLFDGRTLQGWKPTAKSGHSKASGNKTGGRWAAEKGAIVGGQDTPNNGGLLLTEAEYGNVEVSLEMNNDFGPDSGIFLRCTDEGAGYQCLIDYHKGGTLGGILGERIWKRRGERNFTFGDKPEIITINEHKEHPCPVLPDAWPSFWRHGEWNEIRARIVGDPPTITTWVNGVEIMAFTEPVSQHPARGKIGLQVHGGAAGAGGSVRYRNIRVREL